ncbi:MAG: phage portal protein family protein [Flavipsychrobacter sp.]
MSLVTVTQPDKNQKVEVVVHELNVRSVDRTRKDIGTWRQAHITAESVYYPNRSRLYDMYDDVILDGHLSGIIAKRIDAVLNKHLHFEKDGRAVPEMDKLINSLQFRDIMRTIMQTLLWGISGIEFLPGKELAFLKVPRKHIKPNLGIIAYEQSGTDGLAYADIPNIWVMGEPDDLGLLLKCAPYALYKKGNLSDWSQYIELFGQPVRVIKYDAYDEQTKQELKKVLDESGSSLALMIPKQADFEMKDGKNVSGDGRLQLSFMHAMNEEMSILILGNTGTTTTDAGSGYAQSRVHEEQQKEIHRSDMVYTISMLNDPKFLAILRSYGYPVDGGQFCFSKEPELEKLRSRLDIDKEVASIVPVPEDYWYQQYGLPKP